MEEDIKVLVSYLNKYDKRFVTKNRLRFLNAIENLIARNKELEEENESLVKKYEYQGALMTNEYLSKDEIEEWFIPKSKVREKLEKLNQEEIEKLNQEEIELQDSISPEEREKYSDAMISWQLCDIDGRRKILEELLEERN